MTDKQSSRTCHANDCENEAELVLNLPNMDGPKNVCRRYLRRIHPEIDAKTWLEAGYAAWRIRGNENVPTPVEGLRDVTRIEKRKTIDHRFGWDDDE